MYRGEAIKGDSKREFYQEFLRHAEGLLADERNWIANLANISSLLFYQLDELNWAGFYLHDSDELVLGPFQGKPACTRISVGQGVCGTAAQKRKTQLVANVQEFPGHIACDPASKSEIVVPLLKGDELLGVLDLDSPVYDRFDEEDSKHLNELVDLLIQSSDIDALM